MSIPQQTILIIDDDALIGRTLERLATSVFPDFQALWVSNGVRGLELIRTHADNLRLVVLDVQMPLLNGHLVAAQIRSVVPNVPVMPFTSHVAMLPALLELGCVQPVMKHPNVMDELPERMQRAMETIVQPVPQAAWVAALQQSGDAVLAFIGNSALERPTPTEPSTPGHIKKAQDLLAKYCARFPRPAREVILARKALEAYSEH